MEPLTLAEEAYLAYGEVTDFKNFRGEPMPQFKDLPETIRTAWAAAVAKVEDLTRDKFLSLSGEQISAIQHAARDANNTKYDLLCIRRSGLLDEDIIDGAEQRLYTQCGDKIAKIVLDGYLPPQPEGQEATAICSSSH